MPAVIKKLSAELLDKGLFRARDEQIIRDAAGIIKSGGLVAFPTETVYGLGADGFNPAAVRKIFAAKGRPQDNPLILHIAGFDMLRLAARDIPDSARLLAKAFWPGPLTVILYKTSAVPDEVSCRLETVAVRLPENLAARRLIENCGVPIAAPSANKSGSPSPTCARHVRADLYREADMIIDGGRCKHGLESTIIDLTAPVPVILRPGSVTAEMIKEVIGECIFHKTQGDGVLVPKAPGMKYAHYSPKARLTIVAGDPKDTAEVINQRIKENTDIGVLTGVLAADETKDLYGISAVTLCAGSRDRPDIIGHNLFMLLREFDERGAEVIYAEHFGDAPGAEAVMNRLMKAAGHDVIYV